MTWAVLGVSILAVVVSALGAYIAWRQARSGEAQADVARTTLAANMAQSHVARAPEFRASISDLAIDAFNRSVPTTLRIRNVGPTSLTWVEVQFQELPIGVAGFYAGHGVVSQASLGALPVHGDAVVRLALEPHASPSRIDAVLRINCGVDDEPPWAVRVPCTWERYAPAQQPYARPPMVEARRRGLVPGLAILLIGILVAAGLVWIGLKILGPL